MPEFFYGYVAGLLTLPVICGLWIFWLIATDPDIGETDA
jgi:hypothetical protein